MRPDFCAAVVLDADGSAKHAHDTRHHDCFKRALLLVLSNRFTIHSLSSVFSNSTPIFQYIKVDFRMSTQASLRRVLSSWRHSDEDIGSNSALEGVRAKGQRGESELEPMRGSDAAGRNQLTFWHLDDQTGDITVHPVRPRDLNP